MNPVFADTSYFLALLGGKDQHHVRAIAWSCALRATVITTEYILFEVGNSLAKGQDRDAFNTFYRTIRTDKDVEIVPATTALQDRGAQLFAARTDKEWSLTDCVSFTIMSDRGLHEALTADHDFDEAGFRALLRHEPTT